LASIADLEARALARQVDLDVQQAEVTLEESQAALRASTAAAEAARKNAAETTELYRQGLSRVLEVADASVRLFEAEVAQASDRLGLGRAFLDWRTALGLDALGKAP
jgi:outer membrane protein TolC